jgi:Domain of unknown function (DUF4917)
MMTLARHTGWWTDARRRYRLRTFDEAMNEIRPEQDESKKPALLLGNGFSQAWRSSTFSYQALFDRAGIQNDRTLARVFQSLGTHDFEVAIKALLDAAAVAEAFGVGAAQVAEMMTTADRLREALVEAIASVHPTGPDQLLESEGAACAKFLSKFDDIYTVNYDLLLYWVAMKHQSPTLSHNDGFLNSDDPNVKYVVWQYDAKHTSVRYLHGALHLFVGGHELRKLTWCRSGEPLIKQVREQLDDRHFPLYVAEGTSTEKFAKVMQHSYLLSGFKSLRNITRPLVIFGHSIAENDRHVLDAIVRGKIPRVSVGVWGDPKTPENRQLVHRAKTLATERATLAKAKPLTVDFFDSATAKVWR